VSSPNAVAALTVVTLLVVMVVIDVRLLKDLAQTPDDRLLYLTRLGWALVIVLSFPIGPILYLRFAKYR
jgi:ABC-type uncharacterized transport system permease subunit